MYRRYKSELDQAMAGSRLKMVMFLSTVRENRLGERVSKFVQAQLKDKYDVVVFDPLELDLPVMKKALHHYPDPSQAPAVLRQCETSLKQADAFLVVTAEYNHSLPPGLTNMMDHFNIPLYSYKPSGIICYSAGIYGGMRAAMQLRCFLSELGTMSVPDIFGIPEVHKALDEAGQPQNDHLERGLARMVNQLDWYARAMKKQRDSSGLPS